MWSQIMLTAANQRRMLIRRIQVTNVEPVFLAVEHNSVLYDESDEEWCDEVNGTGSVCSRDISDAD